MSFIEPRSPVPAALRSTEVRRATQPSHHTLSANAQAWRRLAVEGYHRTAELVRATRPVPLQADATGRERAPADANI